LAVFINEEIKEHKKL